MIIRFNEGLEEKITTNRIIVIMRAAEIVISFFVNATWFVFRSIEYILTLKTDPVYSYVKIRSKEIK